MSKSSIKTRKNAAELEQRCAEIKESVRRTLLGGANMRQERGWLGVHIARAAGMDYRAYNRVLSHGTECLHDIGVMAYGLGVDLNFKLVPREK